MATALALGEAKAQLPSAEDARKLSYAIYSLRRRNRDKFVDWFNITLNVEDNFLIARKNPQIVLLSKESSFV